MSDNASSNEVTLGPGAPRGSNGTEVQSLSSRAWRRLRRHRMAMWALGILILLHGLALFADFAGPYSEGMSNRQKFYHPPIDMHWFDEDGHLSWPYVYNYKMVNLGRFQYAEDPSQGKYYVKLFYHGEPYKLLWLIPTDVRMFGVDRPAVVYLLGGDKFGRDIFSRLLHGARKSLFIGILGIIISTGLGMVYGGISGFFGGRLDNIMMRLAEVVIAVPSFFLLLALSAVLPMNFPSSWRFFIIIVIFSFVGWAAMSRVIRGMVLSIKQREFVEGAKAIGCTTPRVILRHVLPNTFSYVIVNMTLAVPGFILGESALSLIGVGVQEPEASWGNMLSDALNIVAMTQFPWILVPGLAIFIAVLSWSFFGDGVRDAFDPRAER